jgi:hypothetical protein
MATFCSINPGADHSTDWNTPYPGPKSIVAAIGNNSMSRDQNGLLPDSAIPGLVQNLTSSGVVPRIPENSTNAADLEKFLVADSIFIESAKNEYCYYNQRYVWCINQLFGSLVGPKGLNYMTVTSAQQAVIKKYLDASVQLNQTLNDITKVLKGVSQSRTKDIQSLGSAITKLNAQLDSTEHGLAKQKDILSKGKDTTVLYKEMEKYSKEKNKYTSNMLMLYSFLNITALGLLFYVYRSASE